MKTISRAATMLIAAAALATSVAVADAKTFRWAGKTDPQTLDPHGTNTAPVLGFLNNIYEGLVRRGKDMKLEPALAASWEPIGQDGWRFKLRQGVTFHGGQSFDAEDVLFSYQRASSEQSDVRSWFAPVRDVKVVDSHTVDILTKAPNPLFPSSIANWMIIDKGWAESNSAARPARDKENYATLHANGSGAFMIKSRDPGVKTTLVPFANWWGKLESNITEAVFTPIGTQATGVAALLSGEIDFIEPIPLQDVPRIQKTSGFTVHQGIEARVIMFGFEHAADELRYSNIKGKNPFKDARVRKAAYQAINVDAIIKKVMRGNAQPAGLLISAAMEGFSPQHNERFANDPKAAKALLAEAGYADGFEFGLACPNDRYINDEAICTAAVSMLAQVRLKAKLRTMPVRNYWKELRANNFDMYLLGWSPGTFDAEHPIRFLMHTPNKEKKLGSWNFGKFSDPKVDELPPMVQVELDPAKRQAMLDEIHGILRNKVAYVPLHVQPLVWGSKDNIKLTQRPDNFFILRWVSVN